MRAAVVAAALLCVACTSDEAPGGGAGTTGENAAMATEDLEYAPSLGIDLADMRKTPSGLYIEDTQVGSGEEITAGRTAVVHYTGWLPDGSKFDSSRDAGQPFEVAVGRGEVIAGWDEGLQGMKVGGTRKLVIPPALAYGEMGAGGVIPPGATLVFEVEAVGVR